MSDSAWSSRLAKQAGWLLLAPLLAAIPAGVLNHAFMPVPLSAPGWPCSPASVLTVPAAEISRTRSALSVMKMSPAESIAIPYG